METWKVRIKRSAGVDKSVFRQTRHRTVAASDQRIDYWSGSVPTGKRSCKAHAAAPVGCRMAIPSMQENSEATIDSHAVPKPMTLEKSMELGEVANLPYKKRILYVLRQADHPRGGEEEQLSSLNCHFDLNELPQMEMELQD